MKSKRQIIIIFIGLIFFLFAICISISPYKKTGFGATESVSECVVETTSKRILSSKNELKRLPMASTTKIVTAIIIIEDCNLEDVVIIPKTAEGIEGSSVYLRAGEEYTVLDLLYGLMLRSGNDCAVALALFHSGGLKDFSKIMNLRAKEWGAQNSHFVNPHGLPHREHYTTALDLALISCHAMENEIFEKIVSTQYYVRHKWKNKNKMLWKYEGVIGIKTGFTLESGRCLVTCAERNGMRTVCAVLNSPQMYERTEELLNGCYNSYTLTELYHQKNSISGYYAVESFSYPLTQAELLQTRIEIIPQENKEFGGQMQIFLENDLIFSQNLYMIEE